MVPPGTALSAAAVALSASLPVKSVSVLPFAWCGPCGACPGCGAAGVDDAAGVEVEVVVSAALAVPSKLAPIAPPVTAATAMAPPIAALRRGFMGGSPSDLRPEPFGL